MMRRLVWLALLAGALLLGGISPPEILAQSNTPPEVLELLARLSPEEKVGQLFLVTFEGANVDPDSAIYSLITEYQIGGVVLTQSRSNFNDTNSVSVQAAQLIRALQTAAAGNADNDNSAALTPTLDTGGFVPLFIGLAHSGDSAGISRQIYSELTPLPSAMAIGATWNPDRAEASGLVVGRELAAMGINLLLGPNLSVIDTPNPENPADPGTTSFGGSPYWVSRLGQSFIIGVHTGSSGQIAVVARDFPGLGSADRRLSDDIPTINRSLDRLLAVELAPYAAVTDTTLPAFSQADGLMLVPARYSALQGTITSDTRPLVFDQSAVNQLLDRPEFAPWRANGGLLVSEALGLRAVRRYYTNPDNTFPANNVALDAFLAGNDLLYIDQFTRSSEVSQTDTLIGVLEQFAQRYREDSVFAARVDVSVTRILTKKLQLYGSFDLETTLVDTVLSEVIGQGGDSTLLTAQQSASLIYPDPVALGVRIPRPPTINERIVIISDTVTVRQCAACQPINLPRTDALQQTINRLYGIGGTSQVRFTNVTSYTLTDLGNYLSGISPTPNPANPTAEPDITATPAFGVSDDISRANWVVVLLQDVPTPNNPFRRLLAERPDLLRGKQVIVFSLGAPYYLSSSEIVQISAYYALYGRTTPFIETAARLLFQELNATSASPVSIPASGYNLPARLLPAPSQRIRLSAELLVSDPSATPLPSETPSAEATPLSPIETGERVVLTAGPILDFNNHVVPDGTVVQFFATYRPQGLTEIIGQVTTVDGIARFIYSPGVAGLQEIRAQAGEAANSEIVQLVIPELDGGAVSVPTILPSPTETPTEEPPAPSETPAPDLDGTEGTIFEPSLPTNPGQVNWLHFLAAIGAIMAWGGVGWRIGEGSTAVSKRVKLVLAVAIAVMIGYNYWALQAPGVELLAGYLPGGAPWGAAVLSWLAGLVGLLAGSIWLSRDP